MEAIYSVGASVGLSKSSNISRIKHAAPTGSTYLSTEYRNLQTICLG